MLYKVPGFSDSFVVVNSVTVQCLYHERFHSFPDFTKEYITGNCWSNFNEEEDGQQETKLYIQIDIKL